MGYRINHIHLKAPDPRKTADWYVTAFDFQIVSEETRVFGDLPMDAGEALQAMRMGRARETQWKVPGARLEQKTVGSAMCEVYGRPSVAGHSTCSIPRGKRYVEVDVTAALSDLVAMDIVAALVQKAAARL